MKILYFHQHFVTPKGATGTRSYEFAKALIAAGHTVTMVCGEYQHSALGLPFDKKRGWSRGEIDGIDVLALPLAYSNQDGLGRRALLFLRFAWRSMWIALQEEYDLIFATSTPLTAGIPGVAARVFRGKPFVFEVRDLWPELPRALGMRNPVLLWGMSVLEWASYRSAKGCIGLAPGIVEGIKRRSGSDKPVLMLPNGCDLDLFKPSAMRPVLEGVGEGDFVAAFTGAHGVANGLGSIIAVAAELQRRGNDRIKLLFIGDGKVKAETVRQARDLKLDNCVFMDPLPKTELAELMGRVDAGLMVLKNVPAFYYGTSPNKFFDYISAGIPVVNNYPGWLAGLVEEYCCGLVVPPGSPGEFADALEYLASKPDERRLMGANARRLAEERFSRDTLATSFVDYLTGFAEK